MQSSGLSELTMSARWIEALSQQSAIVTAIFARAGFEPVQPSIIQPATLFLDLLGEDLRARTYVFNDLDGRELCMRPDLTIPTAQLYLDRCGASSAAARYSYNGVVFRYQREAADLIRPREFRQAGIEYFAPENPSQAEVEILALTAESIRAAGLRAFALRLGDLAIFDELLDRMSLPARWRAYLRHHLRHPGAFRRQLQKLMQPETFGRALPKPLLDAIEAARRGETGATDAVTELERHLETRGLQASGTRTLHEIAEQLNGLAEDMTSPPLDPRSALLIDSYVKLNGPAARVPAEVRTLLDGSGIDVEPALDRFETRLQMAAKEGVDLADAPFSGGFGRQFEYYTGFVFEVISPVLDTNAPIAGGGRYDRLVEAISGGPPIAAVGSAIHTERLLLAVRGGRP